MDLFYSYFFRVSRNSFEVIIILLIFLMGYKRKKNYALRSVLTCSALVVLTALFSYVYSLSANTAFYLPCKVAVYILLYVATVSIAFFCYDVSVSSALTLLCSTVACQMITSNVFGLLFPEFFYLQNVHSRILNYLMIFVAFLISSPVYVAVWFSFIRKKRDVNENDGLNRIVVLSAVTLVLLQTISGFIPLYESESYAMSLIAKILIIIAAFLVLFMKNVIIRSVLLNNENKIIEKLRIEEEKHYNQLESSMDLISIKCHDLKHVIGKIEEGTFEGYVNELKDAVNSFENISFTNNKILDIILSEKNSYCIKHGIRFTCMGDASFLSFMSASDMYTLFGNAIDNAIDAVAMFQSDSKKSINLVISVENGFGTVDLMNYYTGEISFKEDVPVTKKSDKNYHGFGVKSMKMVVEKYGGEFSISANGSVFRTIFKFKVN